MADDVDTSSELSRLTKLNGDRLHVAEARYVVELICRAARASR